MTNNKQYPDLPDFEAVEQHIYGACRRYVARDMLEPIHNLIRDGIDADRAVRASQPPALGGDPAEPRDDSDRCYDRPIGYLPAYELGRLNSGHGANLRSAKFGPSALDGDVPVYLEARPPAPREPLTDAEIARLAKDMHADLWGEGLFRFARAIEAAHGITTNKEQG